MFQTYCLLNKQKTQLPQHLKEESVVAVSTEVLEIVRKSSTLNMGGAVTSNVDLYLNFWALLWFSLYVFAYRDMPKKMIVYPFQKYLYNVWVNITRSFKLWKPANDCRIV